MADATTVDRDTLAAIFASRVSLAKKTEEQAVADARLEWQRTQAWVKSPATKRGSFVWCCEEFDLELSAVRRAIAASVPVGAKT